MATYAAVASLKRIISLLLYNSDVVIIPDAVKALKIADKELKSFQLSVERLDSKSRERMKASLAGIAKEIRKFDEDLCSGKLTRNGGAEFIGGVYSLVENFNKYYYSLRADEECVSSSSSKVVSKSKIVGLRDQRRLLKDDLIAPWNEFKLHSLVGMPGIGKTTLAKEFFDDLDTSEWFDCRAWVTTGIQWRFEEITEVVLAQVDPVAHKMVMGGSKEEIGERLKESLKGKRYLIVLDDVWNVEVREYVKSSFPDNQNGSQILLTTRMTIVAMAAVSYPIDVRLLNKEESWDLLRDKVFHGNSCPPHLEKAGQKIAEKCDGLPLTIVTVADLLLDANDKDADDESLWFDVAKKKKHPIFIKAYDQISQVLYPCYEILPDELKLCFLYMGAFLHKYEIPKSRLINSWIAEKLVEKSTNQTLETRALGLLESLKYRNLVMVYKKDITSSSRPYDTHIKTCGLHSSWWHFCQIEARKTKCFYVLDCYNKDNKDSIKEAIEGHNRLSIHNNVLFALKHVYNSIEKICAFTARSLLCFGPYCQYMVPVCFGLKCLRRLDALNIRFYDFPLEVLELVKLRYLALTCNRNLPPSISKLRKLQYLIIHPHLSIKSSKALPDFPIEVWDMKSLKHIEVMGYDLPNVGDTSLQKLRTLLDVTTGSCVVLKRVPNLMKLRVRIELAPDATELLCSLDQISHLTKLESLNFAIVNPEWKIQVVSPVASFPILPCSLNKLSLSGLNYPWEEVRNISSLPNLQALKLRYNAFRGPEWKVEENGFPGLKFLLIEDNDLVKLKCANGSFQCICVLRIKHCYKLKELDFGGPKNFHEIEVVDCNPTVEWYIKSTGIMRSSSAYQLLLCSSWKKNERQLG